MILLIEELKNEYDSTINSFVLEQSISSRNSHSANESLFIYLRCDGNVMQPRDELSNALSSIEIYSEFFVNMTFSSK